MPSAPVIHKFGGAALADGAAIVAAARIVAGHAGPRQPQVVVASALAGVTDALLEVAERAASGDAASARESAARLAQRHHAVLQEIADSSTRDHAELERALQDARTSIDEGLEELARVADGLAALHELTPTVSDTVVARGERLSARLMVAALQAAGVHAVYVDAGELVMTDGRPGNAFPDLARTTAAAGSLLWPLLRGRKVPVIPGYIGGVARQEANGAHRHRARGSRVPPIVTLGRGGSDLTATSLGRALGTQEIILWKDVPGMLTADPRLVESARVISALDPSEASELAYNGAKVLHPRALIPLTAAATGAPPSVARLLVRPFAQPKSAGTVIQRPTDGAAKSASKYPVKAVAAMRDQALVTIRGTGMAGVPGTAARAFSALERVQVSVSLISQASSEQSITLGIANGAVPLALPVLREAFTRELERGEIEGVDVRSAVATVAVIGSGMAGVPGIAARVFAALADADVNILAIAQGSSELSISVVVGDAEAPAAVRALHSAFRLDRIGGGAARAPGHADVILLGLGKVGQELALQLAAARRAGEETTASVEVVGVVDSTGFVFDPQGLSPRKLQSIVRRKQEGQRLAEMRGGRAASAADAMEQIASHALSRPIIVDVTAGDTSALLVSAVRHGMNVVLANKRPVAEPPRAGVEGTARDLMGTAAAEGRRVLHEATVGAGLPVIDTIRKLIESGDTVQRIDACPSGTLGFLFAEMGSGRSFSAALEDASARGFTEPDARDDLSGMDVARKAVILGRLIGWRGSIDDVEVESLVPESLRAVPRDEFVRRAPELDTRWSQRIADAKRRGKVLRYIAEVTPKQVAVMVGEVDGTSSFAALLGTDNQFVFTTRRYSERPLVVTGPGAGPGVTAAGVLNDIMSLAGSR